MAELDPEDMAATLEVLQRVVVQLEADVEQLKAALSRGQSYGAFAKAQFAMFKALENANG